MRKPSKQWVEFGLLVDIIDIRIGKQQRELVKLNRERNHVNGQIQKLWSQIEQKQVELKTLNILDETNALGRLFLRREDCKSHIESLFFDVSIKQQKCDALTLNIYTTEDKKKKLEKRKDALGELRDLIRYEEQ